MNAAEGEATTIVPAGPPLERAPSLDHVSAEFIHYVPIAFARRFRVLGLEVRDGVMPVALSAPETLPALDKVTTLLGFPTEPVFVSDESVLLKALNAAYGLKERSLDSSMARGAAWSLPQEGKNGAAVGDLLDDAGGAPVTRLMNQLLLDAVRLKASDVHVQPFEGHVQVRLRIDGVLFDHAELPQHLLGELVSRVKVMGRMNIAEKRLPQDGRTTVEVGDRRIDLRISTLPTSFGERVVLRLLDQSARLYGLQELGMSDRDRQGFLRLIRQSHGIVLVTGPTGSGKSTSLYAALRELNADELNILTLEDPIEYRIPGISQTQVSDKKGMTFASGLRTVLRQDPDVIMVGEIRDQETARMAIQSSLTGHLVFSTLHTNDAATAVARLVDLGVEPYLVAGSLLGVLAQRLIRRVCPACRRPAILGDDDLRALEAPPKRRGSPIFAAVGCDACHETGYRDRVGVFELLQVDEALAERITSAPKSRAIKEAAQRAGMTTLREDAFRKLLNGETTVEEVLRVTKNDAGDNADERASTQGIGEDAPSTTVTAN